MEEREDAVGEMGRDPSEDSGRESGVIVDQKPKLSVQLSESGTAFPMTPTVGILKKTFTGVEDACSPTRKDCRGQVISGRDETGKTRHSITWPDELDAEERERMESIAAEKGVEKPLTGVAQIHQVASYKAYNKDGEMSNGCTCIIL